jgi:hypothetical protein
MIIVNIIITVIVVVVIIIITIIIVVVVIVIIIIIDIIIIGIIIIMFVCVSGVAKKTRLLAPSEKKVVAYHESGHALVGWLLKYTDALLRVSQIQLFFCFQNKRSYE